MRLAMGFPPKSVLYCFSRRHAAPRYHLTRYILSGSLEFLHARLERFLIEEHTQRFRTVSLRVNVAERVALAIQVVQGLVLVHGADRAHALLGVTDRRRTLGLKLAAQRDRFLPQLVL